MANKFNEGGTVDDVHRMKIFDSKIYDESLLASSSSQRKQEALQLLAICSARDILHSLVG